MAHRCASTLKVVIPIPAPITNEITNAPLTDHNEAAGAQNCSSDLPYIGVDMVLIGVRDHVPAIATYRYRDLAVLHLLAVANAQRKPQVVGVIEEADSEGVLRCSNEGGLIVHAHAADVAQAPVPNVPGGDHHPGLDWTVQLEEAADVALDRRHLDARARPSVGNIGHFVDRRLGNSRGQQGSRKCKFDYLHVVVPGVLSARQESLVNAT